MGEIDTFQHGKFKALGEIDIRGIHKWHGERSDLCDIWPGERTDIASLERNAALLRSEARWQFRKEISKKIVALVFKYPTLCLSRAKSTGKTNLFSILAGAYDTALYRTTNIPKKDYRDD